MEERTTLESSEEIEREAQKFKVLTFADILRALKEHPDWLEEARRIILTHELIELPKKFEEFLKEFQELKGEVQELKGEVQELKERVDKIEKDVEVLKQDVEMLKQDVGVLKQDMKYVKVELGRLKGSDLERRVREKFYAYFGHLLKKARLIEAKELASFLEEAEEQGRITEEQLSEVLRLDLIIEGRIKTTKKEVVLAIEISYSLYEEDIERAVNRANILSYLLGKEVIPTVACVEAKEETKYLAEEQGVFLVRIGDY